ncbi:hypothetical protein [Nostoc commune]|uniref:hypothetical protein n=1 Tax=Nostoc commune TaxID=1178 RepID=UPI0018C6E840|nr:hypothetical protein [Nostoc commune]MBG1261640.1 hypothetical protein [Nostoc commune BAE]
MAENSYTLVKKVINRTVTNVMDQKYKIEEEFRSQNGLNAPLTLTGAEPETLRLRSESIHLGIQTPTFLFTTKFSIWWGF